MPISIREAFSHVEWTSQKFNSKVNSERRRISW